MPKRFSKSEFSISPIGEVMRRGHKKWIVLASVLIVLTAAVCLFLKPRSLAMTDAVPAGVLMYARFDHVMEHLKSLRSSRFWAGISTIDVLGFLGHEDFETRKVAAYIQWRNKVNEVIDSPLFKQFFGREVALALYPQLDNFSNGDWPASFSGALLIVRPDSRAGLTEILGGIWSQYSQEWDSSVAKYKNTSITTVKLNNSGTKIFYARINDLLAVSVDESVLHQVIDVIKIRLGSIKQNQLYNSIVARFYNASNGEFFVDMSKTKVFLRRYWQTLFEHGSGHEESLTQSKIEELAQGFDGINPFGGAYLAGRPMRLKWVVLFDPAQNGHALKRLNACVSANNPTVNMVPADAIAYYWTNCFDFSEQYKEFKGHKEQDAGQSGSVEQPFAELERTWGLSVEKDILPLLGQEMGWFVQGIEVGGLFPVPKFSVFLKVKDPKGAQEILKKIVTTPLTLLQNEDYRNVRFNFVTVPLINAFRPSYGFIDGYLVISTSEKLFKQSIDASQDSALNLTADTFFKQGGVDKPAPNNMLSFVKMGEIVDQSRALVEWVDHWFSLKLQQAEADEKATRQKLQVLSESVEAKGQELASGKERLDLLRQEKASLEAQIQAAAVVMESKNTLSQQGAVQDSTVPDDLRPEKLLEFKKSQVSALELEVYGFEKDIEETKARQPDLRDDLNDFESQKFDALKYRYYINEVVVPVLQGLESLKSQKITTTVKDGVIDSEMVLTVD